MKCDFCEEEVLDKKAVIGKRVICGHCLKLLALVIHVEIIGIRKEVVDSIQKFPAAV